MMTAKLAVHIISDVEAYSRWGIGRAPQTAVISGVVSFEDWCRKEGRVGVSVPSALRATSAARIGVSSAVL